MDVYSLGERAEENGEELKTHCSINALTGRGDDAVWSRLDMDKQAEKEI